MDMGARFPERAAKWSRFQDYSSGASLRLEHKRHSRHGESWRISLLPVFGSARETARSATCSSNLKQIGLAIDQYVQDSGGFYPKIYGMTGSPLLPPPEDGCTWSARIFPYLKSAQVLQCPSFASGEFRQGCPRDEKAPEGVTNWYGNTWDGSYDLGTPANANNARGMMSAVRIRTPSKRILCLDGRGIETAYDAPLTPEKRQELIDHNIPRHRLGLNALFFDGHVKRIPFGDLTTKSFWE